MATNPSPTHVVKHINPGSGTTSLVEVSATNLAAHIATLRGQSIPDANIFVFTPATLEITTVTTFTLNGAPL